jgi:hypothetical protein
MVSRISATLSTDRAVVDPVSCRSSPYHARLAATPLRPSFSGSCARPCGSERASGSIIDGRGQEGAIDCGSTSPRSLDELAQLRRHTTHYSPVMIAPLSDQFARKTRRDDVEVSAARIPGHAAGSDSVDCVHDAVFSAVMIDRHLDPRRRNFLVAPAPGGPPEATGRRASGATPIEERAVSNGRSECGRDSHPQPRKRPPSL